MRHIWSVLCRTSSVDNTSNNISLLEVIEQVKLAGDRLEIPEGGEPVSVPLDWQLVTLWVRSDLETPERGESRLVTLTARGRRVETERVFDVDLREYRRLRTRVQLGAVPIDGPGLYELIVEARSDPDDDWREVSRVPLEVGWQEAD